MNPRWRPVLISAFLAFAAYAISIPGTYIYDDMYIVREDPRIIYPDGFTQLWTRDYNNGGVDNLYRPLVSTTYWLQWRLHGDRAWVFHLINVLLHASVTAVVAEFAFRLIGRRAAWISGTLFAVHPVHVEAVAGIVGRAESICALAMLGAMVLFMHRPMTVRRAIAIGACFVVAVLSKEQGMLLPFILLFLDRLRGWKEKKGPKEISGQYPLNCSLLDSAAPGAQYASPELRDPIHAEKYARQIATLLLCFTLAAYIYLREDVLKLRFYWDRGFLDWTCQPMVRCNDVDRWLMPLVLLGRYTALLFAPLRLSIDYGGSAIGWTVDRSDPYLYLGICAIALWLLLATLAVIRRNGPLLICLLALAMIYGVVGNIVTLIGTNFAERLIYLPSAFFLLAIAALLNTRPLRSKRVVALIMVLLLFSIRTVTYAYQWNDRLRLYTYSLARQPKSIRIYMLMADEYMKRGDLLAAERTDAAGRALQGDYWDIYTQSATVAEKLGKIDQADAFLAKALEIRPSMSIFFRRNELHARHPTSAPTTSP